MRGRACSSFPLPLLVGSYNALRHRSQTLKPPPLLRSHVSLLSFYSQIHGVASSSGHLRRCVAPAALLDFVCFDEIHTLTTLRITSNSKQTRSCRGWFCETPRRLAHVIRYSCSVNVLLVGAHLPLCLPLGLLPRVCCMAWSPHSSICNGRRSTAGQCDNTWCGFSLDGRARGDSTPFQALPPRPVLKWALRFLA